MLDKEKNSDFLEILTREEFQAAYGFVPDNFSQEILKEIQAKTTVKNAQNGSLYRINMNAGEGSRNSAENLTLNLTKLVKLRLVALIFEIRFEPSDSTVTIQSFFITRTEKDSTSREIFDLIMEKSAKAFENYLASPLLGEKNIRNEIINSLNRKNEDRSNMNELDILLQNHNFEVSPKQELLEESKKIIQKLVLESKRILYFPKRGFFHIPKESIPENFQFCLLKFESNVIPAAKSSNIELRDLIESIEKEEYAYEEDPLNSKTYIFRKRIAETIRDFQKDFKNYYGHFVVELIIYFADVIQAGIDNKKKLQVDASANTYFNRILDMRADLETRLLKINLEKDDNFDYSVLTALRRNPEVISVEWNDAEGKVALFAWNNMENIKSLNRLISQRPYQKKDNTILHFKEIVEANEKKIKGLFADQEFIAIYGKNLQRVYLSYIPWYYWIFFMLNVPAMIDSGYSMAKSKIKYEQMDREFKYEKRTREKNKERKDKHKKQLEESRVNKNCEYLIAAMDENYFSLGIIPIISEIIEGTPVLDNETILNLVQHRQFILCSSPESSKDTEGDRILNSIPLYPITREYAQKNKKIVELAEKIQKNKSNEKNFDLTDKQIQRANLILAKLPTLNILP